MSLIYVALAGVWIYLVVKNRLTAYQIHVFMTALIFLKTLNILCKVEDKSLIKRTKTTHGWDVLFYIFSFLKGIKLFTLIVLIAWLILLETIPTRKGEEISHCCHSLASLSQFFYCGDR